VEQPALTRPAAKARANWCAKRSSCSITNSRRSGSQAKAGGQLTRWKASRVEAAAPLYGGVVRAALAGGSSPTTSLKDDGAGAPDEQATVRRVSRRSRDRRRKSGVLVRTTRATSSRRMVTVRGCPLATEGRQTSAEFRGEGSPSGNNARRVSVASIERCVSNGSSSSVTGARVRSMESVATPIHGETRHASRTVVLKLVWVIPTSILHNPRDANHAGSCARTSLPTDDAQHCHPILRKRESGWCCEWHVSRRQGAA